MKKKKVRRAGLKLVAGAEGDHLGYVEGGIVLFLFLFLLISISAR